MNYYAVLLPMLDEEKSTSHRQAHLDYVEQMREENHIFLYGKLKDGAGGLIIYQGEDLQDIEALVKNDPYVTTGARDYMIHPWDMKSDYQFSK
ncbi:MAG TPA: YciI family protein [Pseudogracilibacillus sp.]|nr:YciI family protein [Pseudogracilibacillus sp.]